MTDEFEMYTVYQNPADYPGRFVVRRWTVESGNPEPVPDPAPYFALATLEDCRHAIRHARPDAIRMPRSEGDEPQIVESWI